MGFMNFKSLVNCFVWILKPIFIEICIKLNFQGGGGAKCYHWFMYIAPSSSLLILTSSFKVLLQRFEVVFWCLEWESCTFQMTDENAFKSTHTILWLWISSQFLHLLERFFPVRLLLNDLGQRVIFLSILSLSLCILKLCLTGRYLLMSVLYTALCKTLDEQSKLNIHIFLFSTFPSLCHVIPIFQLRCCMIQIIKVKFTEAFSKNFYY